MSLPNHKQNITQMTLDSEKYNKIYLIFINTSNESEKIDSNVTALISFIKKHFLTGILSKKITFFTLFSINEILPIVSKIIEKSIYNTKSALLSSHSNVFESPVERFYAAFPFVSRYAAIILAQNLIFDGKEFSALCVLDEEKYGLMKDLMVFFLKFFKLDEFFARIYHFIIMNRMF